MTRSAEPLLDIDDIQGNVLAGFDTDHQEFVFLRITDPVAARRWFAYQADRVTTTRQVLAGAPPYLGIAFSYAGLAKLVPDAAGFRDIAFKEGLHRRSRKLGDPIDPAAAGHCANWVVGGPDTEADVVLLVASNDPVEPPSLPDAEILHRESCAKLAGGHEHFGFRDPISQPGVRGRISPDDLLTPGADPARPHEGMPGQVLVWPGEFVFGYPTQDTMDVHHPAPPSTGGPEWTNNGSLLVLRRLSQHVEAFDRFVTSAAERLRAVPELRDITPERLRARVVGRWPRGTPVVSSATGEDQVLAADPRRVNDFGYAGGRARGDDPIGLLCPQAAHVRKAYPRDHETSVDTVASMETHRILRRGLPWTTAADQGLMFAGYQTSFERQFEFIMRSWLNNPHLRPEGDGHDPIAGQHNRRVTGQGRVFAYPYRRFDGVIDRVVLDLPEEWTTPTGGGYFFVPSISALRNVLGSRT